MEHQEKSLGNNFWKMLKLSPIVARACLHDIEKSLNPRWNPEKRSPSMSYYSQNGAGQSSKKPIKQLTLPLTDCPYSFPDLTFLNNEYHRKKSMRDPLYCACCEVNYTYKMAYEKHMRRHGEKMSLDYRCKMCANDFYRMATILDHFRLYHNVSVDETSDLIMKLEH